MVFYAGIMVQVAIQRKLDKEQAIHYEILQEASERAAVNFEMHQEDLNSIHNTYRMICR